MFEALLDKTHDRNWLWLEVCRTCPVLQQNRDFVYEEVLVMKGSCFWLVRRYQTCLQCLCKLVSSDVRDCFCFANFFYLKQKSGSDVITLYRPSYHPAVG